MHVALLGNEPLVKILNNLCRFVSEHGVIIPEGVNVELALAREEELQRLRRVVDITGLSTYAYLDFEKIARFNPMALLPIIIHLVRLSRLENGIYRIILNSTVDLCREMGVVLGQNESVITTPVWTGNKLEISDESYPSDGVLSYVPGSSVRDVNLRLRYGGG